MIPWILSEAIIIALLEHMDAPTSLIFVSAAKFLQPYMQHVDHIKKICVGNNRAYIITYSGKFLSLTSAYHMDGKTPHDYCGHSFVEFVRQHKLIIRKASCGTNHIAAITSTGKLIMCGDESPGQCYLPNECEGDNEILFRKVHCCGFSTLAITNSGRIMVFGEGYEIQKTISATGETFCKVRRSLIYTAAITSSGKLFIWKNDTHNLIDISVDKETKFRKIDCSGDDVAAITTLGKIMMFAGIHSMFPSASITLWNSFRSISCGEYTIGITTDNSWVMRGKCSRYFCKLNYFMLAHPVLRKVKCNYGCVTALASDGELFLSCNASDFSDYENIPTRIKTLIKTCG